MLSLGLVAFKLNIFILSNNNSCHIIPETIYNVNVANYQGGMSDITHFLNMYYYIQF